jgi:hypothetical protein
MQRKTVSLHWLVVILFVVNAAIWIALGISTLVRMEGQGMAAWVLAGLMFGNAGAMLLSGWGLGKEKRGFFYLAVAVLAANIVLSVTDEFGLFDLMVLLIDLGLLALLIASRTRYLPAGQTGVNSLEFPKGRR